MTSNLILITALLVLLTGAANIVLNRMIFKKSIVFQVIAMLAFPILVAVFLGFFVGYMDLKHFIWSAPAALLLFVFWNEMIAKKYCSKYMPICDRNGQLLCTLLILYRR